MKKLLSIFIIFSLILSAANITYGLDITFDETEKVYSTGLEIAEPKDIKGNDIELTPAIIPYSLEAYPSYYSLVDLGKSTSIKDQGYTGNCWAFAASSAVESNLLKKNIVNSPSDIDISESQIVWNACRNNDNDINKGDGENYDIPYLIGADWDEYLAAVIRGSCDLEENAPFYPYELAKMYYGDSDFDKSNYYHINSVEKIPVNIDLMKEKLMTTGEIYIGFYMNQSIFNYTNNSYYDPASKTANHGVTIVGWDDNYSKDNFTDTPEGDGAWIVKNSWGTEWADNGYFMMSYYQKIEECVVFTADTKDSYDNVYMYDGAGYYKDKYLEADSDTAIYGNIYTADNNESLTSVGIYTLDNSLSYTIDIYKGVTDTPNSGTKVLSQEGVTPYFGYYTIDLENEIPLEKGDVFSVVVTQKNTSGSVAYIPCEIKSINGKTYSYSVKSGQSYIFKDGTYIDATNYTGDYTLGNVCIKAFTKYNSTDNMLQTSLNTLSDTISEYSAIEKGDYTSHSYTRLQNGISKAKAFLDSNPRDYKIVDNYVYMLRGYYASLQRPLYISTASEFISYANSFNNRTIKTTEAELTNDIELNSSFNSAGRPYKYYGDFRGNNHKITNITKPLFYNCINANISGIRGQGNVSSTGNTAGIVYILDNNSTLSKCSFSGSVTSTGTNSICGGLVYNAKYSKVTDCYNNSTVTGTYVGGVVAVVNNSDVINSFDSSGTRVAISKNNGNFVNCYTNYENDSWVNVISDEELKEYSLAHSLNTTGGSELNSGIWSSDGTQPVFADSENAAVYSVKLNEDNTIYRKANEDTTLPLNPVYNNRVVLNWIYNNENVNTISNIAEDIALSCDDALLGDVDESNEVNIKDGATILKFASNISNPSDRQKIIGDCNRNGDIDILDVLKVLS